MCYIIHQSTCIPIFLLIDISINLKIMTWIARQLLHGMVVKVACDHRRCNKFIPTAARYVIFLHWWKKTSPLSCLISAVALPCSNPAGSAKYPYPSSDLYPAIKTCSASRLLLPRLWPNNLGSKLLTLTEVDPWALGKTKACVDFFPGQNLNIPNGCLVKPTFVSQSNLHFSSILQLIYGQQKSKHH